MIILTIVLTNCHYHHIHQPYQYDQYGQTGNRQTDLQMDFVGSVIGGAVEAATSKGGALVTTIITISLHKRS